MLANIVAIAKVENRATPKISRKLTFGLLCHCVAFSTLLRIRRGRLLMVSPVDGDYRRIQAETSLIDLFKFAEPATYRAAVSRPRLRPLRI
jgi:hypothetical protein